MGGYGSGRHGGRPIAEHCLRIDLAWMLRTNRANEGYCHWGTLNWTCGGSPSGSVNYSAEMDQPGRERLELRYKRGSGDDTEQVRQTIQLCHTIPHYGGKRWWMICPYRSVRVGKLYLPPGGDRFASRNAWRLGYQSQRNRPLDNKFERLFSIQKKLGCEQGWGNSPRKPKGMWWRTYWRHMEEFWELDAQCGAEMMAWLGRLSNRVG